MTVSILLVRKNNARISIFTATNIILSSPEVNPLLRSTFFELSHIRSDRSPLFLRGHVHHLFRIIPLSGIIFNILYFGTIQCIKLNVRHMEIVGWRYLVCLKSVHLFSFTGITQQLYYFVLLQSLLQWSLLIIVKELSYYHVSAEAL